MKRSEIAMMWRPYGAHMACPYAGRGCIKPPPATACMHHISPCDPEHNLHVGKDEAIGKSLLAAHTLFADDLDPDCR